MKKFDVTALGEILIDFTFAGLSDRGEHLFEQNPGGAPANVLAAVTKLGGKTSFIGKVGKDMHGKFLKNTVEKYGIDISSLIETDEAFTTLAFVDLNENGDRSFSFARKPGADTLLSDSDISKEQIESSKVFHFGSLSLTDEPAKSATLKALRYAKEADVIVSYDPNYRPSLWKDEDTAKDGMRLPLEMVDIIKISDEEMALLTDCNTPDDAADVLHKKGIACVIITMGEKGAFVSANGKSVFVEGVETKVVDTTGAGDCFMGAFLYSILNDNKKPAELCIDDLNRYASFANAAASICVSRRGAINAMPSIAEVENVIKNSK